MKTLSDFKKRLKVGVLLSTIFHHEFNGRDEKGEPKFKDKDLGIRPVSIVQSNSFALKTKKADGSETNSWCAYPKASNCKILDENTIQILEEDYRVREGEKPLIPILTYKFV